MRYLRAQAILVPVAGLVVGLLLETMIDGTGIGLVRLGVPWMFLMLVRRPSAMLIGVLTAINYGGHLLASHDVAFSSSAALGDLTAVLVSYGAQLAWRSWPGGIDTPMGYMRAAGSLTLGSTVGAVGWWMTMSHGIQLPVDVVTADVLGVLALAPLVTSWQRGWPRNHPFKMQGMLAAGAYLLIAWANMFPPIPRAGRHMLQAAALLTISWMVLRAGRRFTSIAWLGSIVFIWVGMEHGITLLGHESLTLEEAMLTTRVTLMGLGFMVFGAVFGMLGYQQMVRRSAVSEERSRAMAAAAPDAMVVVGLDGRVRFANDRFVELFGDVAGSPLGQCLPGIIEATHAAEPSTCIVVDARREDGSEFPVEVTSARYNDVDGSPLLTLSVRDVTERREQQHELERFASDLSRTNKDLAQFAYAASHDLQEPLRTVASYVTLLQHRYAAQLDATAGEYIGLATDGAERLQALVADLLEYSSASTQELGVRPICLRAPAEEAIGFLEGQIRKSNATVELGDLPTLNGDGVALRRIFQSLLSNSIKFVPEGRAPCIRIWSEPSPEGTVVMVSDNGLGIPEEHRDQVLEPFRRLHARHRYAGTGLGLAMVRRLVERHGGRIWIEDSSEGGTTVCFTLRGALRRIA